jgi:hypothetical protein
VAMSIDYFLDLIHDIKHSDVNYLIEEIVNEVHRKGYSFYWDNIEGRTRVYKPRLKE